MRMISFWLFIFAMAAFTSGAVHAQESATQQQIDQINGKLQDIVDAQEQQSKRLDTVEQEISSLQDKLNQPGGNNFASADDLKKLAEQVQEIDKKRQDDNEKILAALEKLGKTGGVTTSHRPVVSTSTDNSGPTPTVPQKGYDYTIANGDTVAAIAKAYRAQGVKVTVSQILAANPGLDPKNLIVGKKIFIPDPNAK